MSTLAEMAAAYRAASAKMAIGIRARKAAGATEAELRPLREALEEMRAVQRTLDGYYDLPRDPAITSAGWHGRRPSRDDH